MGPGQFQGIEGGVDDPHLPSARLGGKQVLVAARDPEHVAERTEHDLWPAGDDNRLVNQLHGRDADGTPRAVDKRHRRGEEFVNPEPDDGVRLPAADLHDHPRLGHDPVDGPRVLLNLRCVTILVKESHGYAFRACRRSPSSARYSNTRAASLSSTVLMANPTWTIT